MVKKKISCSTFEKLFEHNREAIFLVEEDGVIFICNEAAANLLEYDKKEIIGKSISDFYLNQDKEQIKASLSKLIENTHFEIETHIKSKSNHTINVNVSATIIKNDGKLMIQITLRDITGNKFQELQLKRLSTAVEQSSAALVLTDAEGNVEYVNPQFEAFTGYSFSEIKGKNVNLLKSGFHHEEYYESMWRTLKAGKVWNGEFYNRRKDGSNYWESATITPIFGDFGELTNYIAVKQDITEQKKYIEQIIDSSESLRESIEKKDRLLSIISHDLINPLSGLMGLVSIMLMEVETSKRSEMKDYLEIMNASMKNTFDMLNNLLIWSRSQQNHLACNPSIVDFMSMVNEVIPSLLALGNSKNINFVNDFDESIDVFADKEMIKTVLRNLITNAIKFTPNGGMITIGAELVNDQVTISVTDSGIGMDKETVDKLFTMDKKATRSGTNGERGTGLGLLLCKDFLEKHNTFLSVSSVESSGTRFSFKLKAPYV